MHYDAPVTPRTQAQRRESTRAKLLDAALEVFAERGFHAASVDQVARAAGVSTGALYKHFDSKAALFLGVLHEAIPRWVDSYAKAIEGTNNPVKAMAGQWAWLADNLPQGWLLLLDMWAVAVRDDDLRPQFAQRYDELRAAVARASKQAADARSAKARRRLPADQLATLVVALGDGLAIQRIADPGAVPADLFAKALRLLLEE